MRDRNAYENSSVWNMVSEIKQDEYINSLSPGMRNYLMYLLEDIRGASFKNEREIRSGASPVLSMNS